MATSLAAEASSSVVLVVAAAATAVVVVGASWCTCFGWARRFSLTHQCPDHDFLEGNGGIATEGSNV